MGVYQDIRYWIESKYLGIQHMLESAYFKKKYPDYENNEYNIGHLKYVWGIKSFSDLTKGNKSHFYSMSDIDIIYDRKNKLYSLGIETAYLFDDQKKICDYLKELLNVFTKFMDERGYSKDKLFPFFFGSPTLSMTSDSIEGLYTNFRIFVEGYCKVYE